MEIPEKMDSKFRYVLVAAKRAEQLVRGAQAKVEKTSRKPTRVAMAEIGKDLVDWGYGPPPAADGAEGQAESEESTET
jgi:DNA-directed RNA polymerase subunit omega